MLGAFTHQIVSLGSNTLLDLSNGKIIHINVNPAEIIRGELNDKQIALLVEKQLKHESEMEKTVLKMIREQSFSIGLKKFIFFYLYFVNKLEEHLFTLRELLRIFNAI